MKNKFYSHILEMDPVHEKFSQINISEPEKNELLDILHSHIHITVIDVILSELGDDKKKEFLHLVAIKEDHSAAWEFVLANIEQGEDKVKSAIDAIIKEFVRDLDEHTF